MSRVTINNAAINDFFSRTPLAGTGLSGLTSGSARILAERMARKARQNIAEDFQVRTGDLAGSIEPIVRQTPRGLEVGVGTTVEHGLYLEEGTGPHEIMRFTRGGIRVSVSHPGNRDYRFMQRAVDDVMRGLF